MNSDNMNRRLTLVEAAEAENLRLKDDPNIMSVGFGLKLVKGKPIAQACLQYYVVKKFADEQAIRQAGSNPIPSEVHGCLTDVIELAPFIPDSPTGERGNRREDPLVGGTSTAALGEFLPFPTNFGTLGGICYQNNKEMALSNAHVWGSQIGDDVVQPFKPTDELLGASLIGLGCGPFTLLFAEDLSGLTGVLTWAAGASWMLFAAGDAKDPHRRGQEATVPAQPNELTKVESVTFAAEPETLPLPGTPFSAKVSWEYTRQTDQATYPFNVNETRTNEHVLIRKHIWTEEPVYYPGQTVKIKALLETIGTNRADAFHVVVHLVPQNQSGRRITRVLHPAACNYVPFLCVGFSQAVPDSQANFPIQQQNIIFQANVPCTFRDWWAVGTILMDWLSYSSLMMDWK